jgi:hypothetical protein
MVKEYEGGGVVVSLWLYKENKIWD